MLSTWTLPVWIGGLGACLVEDTVFCWLILCNALIFKCIGLVIFKYVVAVFGLNSYYSFCFSLEDLIDNLVDYQELGRLLFIGCTTEVNLLCVTNDYEFFLLTVFDCTILLYFCIICLKFSDPIEHLPFLILDA